MSKKAFKRIQDYMQIEFLKTQSPENINDMFNKLDKQLNAYKKTINQIDDYLEHAGDSEIKRRIMSHIDKLTNELSNMQVKS
jgi:archaellum component FlaC